MGKHKRDVSSSSGESSSSSEEEEERRHSSKKAKKEKHSNKKDKKEKRSSKKKDKKHGKRDKKDKKGGGDLVKQAKAYLEAHLQGGGSAAGPPPGLGHHMPPPPPQQPVNVEDKNRITLDDYFTKNAEFTLWLQESLNLFFNDLTEEQTKDFFAKFVQMWNAGLLAPKYYTGGAAAAPLKRTSHTWGFAARGGGAGGGADGSSKGVAAFLEDERARKMESRGVEKQEQRRWRADQRQELDEMLPKATGREALVEKRIARREDARARDASPDMARLPGGGDMMGGDESFAAAKARESGRHGQQRNRMLLQQEQAQQKVSALQAKEDERMAAFRALVAQGPIQIAKRT